MTYEQRVEAAGEALVRLATSGEDTDYTIEDDFDRQARVALEAAGVPELLARIEELETAMQEIRTMPISKVRSRARVALARAADVS